MADSLYPGRFMNSMILDYGGWDDANWSDRAVEQINEGHRLGAAGLKEYKRLGLFLKDGSGKLIRIDDPKLGPVWQRCGELGMPVSIHVGDPKAFWLLPTVVAKHIDRDFVPDGKNGHRPANHLI